MKTWGRVNAIKKVIFIGLFLFIVAFSISAQNMPSISIFNHTGYTIYYIYVSPSDSDTWGKDVLGDKVLYDGDVFTYQLQYPLSRVSVYDIALEDEDGDPYYQWEIDVSKNTRIVFTFDDIDLD